jgi:hypothetical protein
MMCAPLWVAPQQNLPHCANGRTNFGCLPAIYLNSLSRRLARHKITSVYVLPTNISSCYHPMKDDLELKCLGLDSICPHKCGQISESIKTGVTEYNRRIQLGQPAKSAAAQHRSKHNHYIQLHSSTWKSTSMDGVIELQFQPSNMNRKDSRILAGHANCSFIASSDSTVGQSSRWLTCSWSLPGQLPSPLSHNLPDSLLGTARCPPSLTTPFRPLLTCSHSGLCKGLHVQGGVVVVTRPLQVEQETPVLHGN